MEFNHKPVLLKQCIEGLNIKENGIYVDGTLGGAGHSKEILKRLSSKGMLIGIDRDFEALDTAKERLKDFPNVKFIHDNHDQIDEKQRGFSYMLDSELDMRMDRTQTFTAKELVNTYKEEQLSNIIYEYGEEKHSRRIAKKICEYRKNKIIETTLELVEIIKMAMPYIDKSAGHPAICTL